MAAISFGVNLLFPLLRQNHCMGFVITKKAKPQYRQIIRRLPEFEKADRFKMNLINCAMLGAFILSMPQRPEVDRLTEGSFRSL